MPWELTPRRLAAISEPATNCATSTATPCRMRSVEQKSRSGCEWTKDGIWKDSAKKREVTAADQRSQSVLRVDVAALQIAQLTQATPAYPLWRSFPGIRTGVPTLDRRTRSPTLTVNSFPSTEISMLAPLNFSPFSDAFGDQLGVLGLTVTAPSISKITPNIPKIIHSVPDAASKAFCRGVSLRYSIWLATSESPQ